VRENSTFLKKYVAGKLQFDSKSEFLSQLFDRFLIQTHKHMIVYEIGDQMKDFWWWNGGEISHFWLVFAAEFEQEEEEKEKKKRKENGFLYGIFSMVSHQGDQ
jgi:hypothetical protein